MARSNPVLFQKALDELSAPAPRKLRLRPFGEARTLWLVIGLLIFLSVIILIISVFKVAILFFCLYVILFPIIALWYGSDLLKIGRVEIVPLVKKDTGFQIFLDGKYREVCFPGRPSINFITENIYYILRDDEEVILLVDPKRPSRHIVYCPQRFLRVPVLEKTVQPLECKH
jgi:hypothetical protein